MKILYYTCEEYTFADCYECMQKLGWQVELMSYQLKDYDVDEQFMELLRTRIRGEGYDYIFTFYYFPVIARVAQECQVKYVAWIFDSPHYALDSITLSNDCNTVFDFDFKEVEKYRRLGVKTIHYMPLAYNATRLESQLGSYTTTYEHEVTFLGTLYKDDYDFLSQIRYLPPELKGYIDALMQAQRFIYGYDFCDTIFTEQKCNEMAQYVKVDMGALYRNNRNDIFRNMIRKRMTVLERSQILAQVGERYKLDLYSARQPENIACRYLGYADYTQKMPRIFNRTKVNLNITLRSIRSGIPLRIIDILGARGFVISNYQQEMDEYFVNGTDLVWYEDEEDLCDKIGYYLEHETVRESIAASGHRKAAQYFTYEQLLPQIFEIAARQ